MSASTSLSVNKNGFTRTNFAKQNLHGFTLVELLISISIIAILSAIGLIVYVDVLKQGRDAKRQSDLRTIQSALEQYNHDQGYYPADGEVEPDSPISYGSGASTRTYLVKVPRDPTPANTFDYCYKALPASGDTCDNDSANKCVKYELNANLEASRRFSLIKEALADLPNTQSQGFCGAGSPPRIDISWVLPGHTEGWNYAVRINDLSNDGPAAGYGWLVDGSGDIEDARLITSDASGRYNFSGNGIIGHSYHWWVEAGYDDSIGGPDFTCPAAAPAVGGGAGACAYACDGMCYNYQITPP